MAAGEHRGRKSSLYEEIREELAMSTVYDIIEEVKIEMCEEYCRFPREWDEEVEQETLNDAKCAKCPLNRLG